MAPNSGGPFAYYTRPSVDGKRKGAFYISLVSTTIKLFRDPQCCSLISYTVCNEAKFKIYR